MILRQAEDRAALATLAASSVHLPFLDSAYGTRYALADVTQALAQHLDATAPQSVLVPLGIFHADHVTTSRAATALIKARPHIRWSVYEELPYRFEYPDLRDAQKLELQDEGFTLLDLTLPRDRSKRTKLRTIRCYRSQAKALGWNRIRKALRDEQYWQLSALREP